MKLGVVLVLVILGGCVHQQADVFSVQKALNGMCMRYPLETYEVATNTLQQGIALLNKCPDTYYKNCNMFILHARLFWVYDKAGLREEANIAYEKTRYWSIVEMETVGFSVKDINAHSSTASKSMFLGLVDKFHRVALGTNASLAGLRFQATTANKSVEAVRGVGDTSSRATE